VAPDSIIFPFYFIIWFKAIIFGILISGKQ
jgi:hypothetical protein